METISQRITTISMQIIILANPIKLPLVSKWFQSQEQKYIQQTSEKTITQSLNFTDEKKFKQIAMKFIHSFNE